MTQLPIAAQAPPPGQPAVQPPEVPKPVNLRLRRAVVDRLEQLPGKPRSAGFHPSSLHKMCPVFHYFTARARERLAVEPAQSMAFLHSCMNAKVKEFPGHLQLEFELGDAIHAQVQYHLGAIGVLWGMWMCPHCDHKVGPSYMPRVTVAGANGVAVVDGAPCVRCKGRNRRERWKWRYLEPKAESEEWGIKGRCDGLIVVERTVKKATKTKPAKTVIYRCALEIKSINEYGWSEGKKKPWEDIALEEGWTPPPDWRPALIERVEKKLPKEEHITQASTYAWLMELDLLYFVYVNKNKASAWKEIMVPIDRAHLDIATRKMTAANQGLKQDRPPLEARICPDIREDTARNCPACEACFGRPPNANFWDDPLE